MALICGLNNFPVMGYYRIVLAKLPEQNWSICCLLRREVCRKVKTGSLNAWQSVPVHSSEYYKYMWTDNQYTCFGRHFFLKGGILFWALPCPGLYCDWQCGLQDDVLIPLKTVFRLKMHISTRVDLNVIL